MSDASRERFEAWAYTKGWRNFTRHESSGNYVVDVGLELRWIGWQAALAEPAAALPAEAVELLRSIADHCAEYWDHAPESFRKRLMKLANQARFLVNKLATPAIAPEPTAQEVPPMPELPKLPTPNLDILDDGFNSNITRKWYDEKHMHAYAIAYGEAVRAQFSQPTTSSCAAAGLAAKEKNNAA